ncbi:hypothetical protein HanXRQr2_Chr16g0729351 [Helianthus annuus]|uniref:Uncharacterized protein n=1 Tax=Helianthus annuus TaxID=4232 RepID=A0A9K3DQM0_HELAN|nr:hypothetical protein HanXRQr2_Chr16g0729351 [Helianthus annuus]
MNANDRKTKMKSAPHFDCGVVLPLLVVVEPFVELFIKEGRRNNGSPRNDHISKVANCPVSGM